MLNPLLLQLAIKEAGEFKHPVQPTNYRMAFGAVQRCASCVYFNHGHCNRFDIGVDQNFTCDEWRSRKMDFHLDTPPSPPMSEEKLSHDKSPYMDRGGLVGELTPLRPESSGDNRISLSLTQSQPVDSVLTQPIDSTDKAASTQSQPVDSLSTQSVDSTDKAASTQAIDSVSTQSKDASTQTIDSVSTPSQPTHPEPKRGAPKVQRRFHRKSAVAPLIRLVNPIWSKSSQWRGDILSKLSESNYRLFQSLFEKIAVGDSYVVDQYGDKTDKPRIQGLADIHAGGGKHSRERIESFLQRVAKHNLWQHERSKADAHKRFSENLKLLGDNPTPEQVKTISDPYLQHLEALSQHEAKRTVDLHHIENVVRQADPDWLKSKSSPAGENPKPVGTKAWWYKKDRAMRAARDMGKDPGKASILDPEVLSAIRPESVTRGYYRDMLLDAKKNDAARKKPGIEEVQKPSTGFLQAIDAKVRGDGKPKGTDYYKRPNMFVGGREIDLDAQSEFSDRATLDSLKSQKDKLSDLMRSSGVHPQHLHELSRHGDYLDRQIHGEEKSNELPKPDAKQITVAAEPSVNTPSAVTPVAPVDTKKEPPSPVDLPVAPVDTKKEPPSPVDLPVAAPSNVKKAPSAVNPPPTIAPASEPSNLDLPPRQTPPAQPPAQPTPKKGDPWKTAILEQLTELSKPVKGEQLRQDNLRELKLYADNLRQDNPELAALSNAADYHHKTLTERYAREKAQAAAVPPPQPQLPKVAPGYKLPKWAIPAGIAGAAGLTALGGLAYYMSRPKKKTQEDEKQASFFRALVKSSNSNQPLTIQPPKPGVNQTPKLNPMQQVAAQSQQPQQQPQPAASTSVPQVQQPQQPQQPQQAATTSGQPFEKRPSPVLGALGLPETDFHTPVPPLQKTASARKSLPGVDVTITRIAPRNGLLKRSAMTVSQPLPTRIDTNIKMTKPKPLPPAQSGSTNPAIPPNKGPLKGPRGPAVGPDGKPVGVSATAAPEKAPVQLSRVPRDINPGSQRTDTAYS
jgi:hypothetical protein